MGDDWLAATRQHLAVKISFTDSQWEELLNEVQIYCGNRLLEIARVKEHEMLKYLLDVLSLNNAESPLLSRQHELGGLFLRFVDQRLSDQQIADWAPTLVLFANAPQDEHPEGPFVSTWEQAGRPLKLIQSTARHLLENDDDANDDKGFVLTPALFDNASNSRAWDQLMTLLMVKAEKEWNIPRVGLSNESNEPNFLTRLVEAVNTLVRPYDDMHKPSASRMMRRREVSSIYALNKMFGDLRRALESEAYAHEHATPGAWQGDAHDFPMDLLNPDPFVGSFSQQRKP